MTVPLDEEKSDSNGEELEDATGDGQKSSQSEEDEEGIWKGEDNNVNDVGENSGSAAKVEDDKDEDPIINKAKVANGLRCPLCPFTLPFPVSL